MRSCTGPTNWKNMERVTRNMVIRNLVLPNCHTTFDREGLTWSEFLSLSAFSALHFLFSASQSLSNLAAFMIASSG